MGNAIREPPQIGWKAGDRVEDEDLGTRVGVERREPLDCRDGSVPAGLRQQNDLARLLDRALPAVNRRGSWQKRDARDEPLFYQGVRKSLRRGFVGNKRQQQTGGGRGSSLVCLPAFFGHVWFDAA